jgi:signal transduction histidine kinase
MHMQALLHQRNPRSRSGGSRWLLILGDSALALFLAALGVVAAVSGPPVPHGPAVIALALLQTLPLAFRRRRPAWVLAVVVAASTAAVIVGGTLVEPFGLLVALYSVAAHCPPGQAMRAGAAAAAVLAWPLLRDSDYKISAAVLKLGFLAVGWMSGAYLGELRARTARSRREQDLETRRAVAEEQARIGRELHDVIAHTLSVIVIQAAAAEDVFDSSPDRARQALRSIESAGRQALSELRQVLDAVRPAGSQRAERAPPGLSQLGALISQVRAAGLAVTVRIDGTAADLPAGLDMSVYRIVQEALTNTLKHARASTAQVILRYRPAQFALEVLDDGNDAEPAADPDARPGRGLIGMQERAAAYGGNLTAGGTRGGGFRVYASFPLTGNGPPP